MFDMKEKSEEIIKKLQSDPKLLAEFKSAPSKTIEKLAGIDIPDLIQPQIEKLIKEKLG